MYLFKFYKKMEFQIYLKEERRSIKKRCN